jgi:hypothetical protein
MSFIPGPLRLRRENQRFFINTNEVRGAQSVSVNYAIPTVPLKHIGQTGTHRVVDGPYGGTASVSANLLTGDPFLKYTGEAPFNGYLFETEDGRNLNGDAVDIAFTSGFLSSYTINCAIGQIPLVDAQIQIAGNIGKLPSGESTSSRVSSDYAAISSTENKDFSLKIADPRSLQVSINDFETNRLNSFNISFEIPRTPVYTIGGKMPIKCFVNYPISVTCNFQIDLDAHDLRSKSGYSHKVLRDFPCTENTENLTLTFYDHFTESQIVQYSFTDLLLVSQNHSTNIDGNVVANLTYQALINKNKQ